MASYTLLAPPPVMVIGVRKPRNSGIVWPSYMRHTDELPSKSKPLKLACCCICSAVRPTAPALSLVAPVVWKKLPVTAPPLAPAPTSALTTSVQLDLTAPLLYVAFKVPYIPL